MVSKLFVGPVSKNTVDSVIEYSIETGNSIGLIPSRRQIDWNTGYVNEWTTKSFAEYVNSKNPKIILERDHGGVGQSELMNDDHLTSFTYDALHFDIVHIDPLKYYKDLSDIVNYTSNVMSILCGINPNIKFEIGTEQSIRDLTVYDLEKYIVSLQNVCGNKLFSNIEYLVIQSGTKLSYIHNIGSYDEKRLLSMLELGNKFNLKTKEHNGDHLQKDLIKHKFNLGLSSINIAPEFGNIETKCYIDYGININKFFDLCYKSNKWKKWVEPSFNPYNNKLTTILISGHYIYSTDEFKEIKPDCDTEVKNRIKERIKEFYE